MKKTILIMFLLLILVISASALPLWLEKIFGTTGKAVGGVDIIPIRPPGGTVGPGEQAIDVSDIYSRPIAQRPDVPTIPIEPPTTYTTRCPTGSTSAGTIFGYELDPTGKTPQYWYPRQKCGELKTNILEHYFLAGISGTEGRYNKYLICKKEIPCYYYCNSLDMPGYLDHDRIPTTPEVYAMGKCAEKPVTAIPEVPPAGREEQIVIPPDRPVIEVPTRVIRCRSPYKDSGRDNDLDGYFDPFTRCKNDLSGIIEIVPGNKLSDDYYPQCYKEIPCEAGTDCQMTDQGAICARTTTRIRAPEQIVCPEGYSNTGIFLSDNRALNSLGIRVFDENDESNICSNIDKYLLNSYKLGNPIKALDDDRPVCIKKTDCIQQRKACGYLPGQQDDRYPESSKIGCVSCPEIMTRAKPKWSAEFIELLDDNTWNKIIVDFSYDYLHTLIDPKMDTDFEKNIPLDHLRPTKPDSYSYQTYSAEIYVPKLIKRNDPTTIVKVKDTTGICAENSLKYKTCGDGIINQGWEECENKDGKIVKRETTFVRGSFTCQDCIIVREAVEERRIPKKPSEKREGIAPLVEVTARPQKKPAEERPPAREETRPVERVTAAEPGRREAEPIIETPTPPPGIKCPEGYPIYLNENIRGARAGKMICNQDNTAVLESAMGEELPDASRPVCYKEIKRCGFNEVCKVVKVTGWAAFTFSESAECVPIEAKIEVPAEKKAGQCEIKTFYVPKGGRKRVTITFPLDSQEHSLTRGQQTTPLLGLEQTSEGLKLVYEYSAGEYLASAVINGEIISAPFKIVEAEKKVVKEGIPPKTRIIKQTLEDDSLDFRPTRSFLVQYDSDNDRKFAKEIVRALISKGLKARIAKSKSIDHLVSLQEKEGRDVIIMVGGQTANPASTESEIFDEIDRRNPVKITSEYLDDQLFVHVAGYTEGDTAEATRIFSDWIDQQERAELNQEFIRSAFR